jgi:hypothetical protein
MLERMIAHHRDVFARFLNVPARESEIREAQAALVRMYAIEDSRLWRWLGWTARPGEEAGLEDPRRRLARIEAGRAYRLIRALKSTSVYRRYARRRYGPAFVDPTCPRP